MNNVLGAETELFPGQQVYRDMCVLQLIPRVKETRLSLATFNVDVQRNRISGRHWFVEKYPRCRCVTKIIEVTWLIKK